MRRTQVTMCSGYLVWRSFELVADHLRFYIEDSILVGDDVASSVIFTKVRFGWGLSDCLASRERVHLNMDLFAHGKRTPKTAGSSRTECESRTLSGHPIDKYECMITLF